MKDPHDLPEAANSSEEPEVAFVAAQRSMEIGAALHHRDRVAEAVLGMVKAGATTSDVLSGLVMAGALRQRDRWFDRLPGFGRYLGRRALPYELVLPSDDDLTYR